MPDLGADIPDAGDGPQHLQLGLDDVAPHHLRALFDEELGGGERHAHAERFLIAMGQAPGHTVGEVVFNTALTGYQEILTDPSYCRQIVTLTPAANFQLNIDGQQVTNNGRAGAANPRVSQEAVGEFQFVASRWDASQGRSNGVLVNAAAEVRPE